MRLKLRHLKAVAWQAPLILAAGAVLIALVAYLFPPSLARLKDQGRIIDGENGTPIAYFPDATGEWKFATPAAAVNPLMLHMLVRIEDKRFWYNPGVDPVAILRATAQFAATGHVVSGASTLTMEVVRLLHPAPRTFEAKLREALQAISLTEHYSKNQILSMWLSLAPFGGSITGVKAASRLWFGVSPRSLDPAQAALLIALCRRPEALRPDLHPQAARRARNRILAQAAREGVINAATATQAEAEPVPRHWQTLPRQTPQLTIGLATDTRTTLNPALNAALARLAGNVLTKMRPAESLAILIINAKTRMVRAAYLGDPGNLPRAGFIDLSQAIRSPGSALKPFLYGLAFAEGYAGPRTLLYDLPHDFSAYGPEDFTHSFMGTVSTATALRRSLNLPAVALLNRYGAARFWSALNAVGVPLALPYGAEPSLPVILGGDGLTMRQLGALYAGLATDGCVQPLHFIHGQKQVCARLLSADIADEVANILTRPLPGYLAKGIAWKTGTSAGNRDDWAIGFDRRHVVIVWTGRPDGGALPGAAAIGRAVPILASTFGLLQIYPRQVLPPAKPLNLVAVQQKTPLTMAYPPPHAVLADIGPIRLRVIGGVRPLTFLIDGVPLNSVPALRSAHFVPSGPGFYHLRVIDANGASVTEMLQVKAATSLPSQ